MGTAAQHYIQQQPNVGVDECELSSAMEMVKMPPEQWLAVGASNAIDPELSGNFK